MEGPRHSCLRSPEARRFGLSKRSGRRNLPLPASPPPAPPSPWPQLVVKWGRSWALGPSVTGRTRIKGMTSEVCCRSLDCVLDNVSALPPQMPLAFIKWRALHFRAGELSGPSLYWNVMREVGFGLLCTRPSCTWFLGCKGGPLNADAYWLSCLWWEMSVLGLFSEYSVWNP